MSRFLDWLADKIVAYCVRIDTAMEWEREDDR